MEIRERMGKDDDFDPKTSYIISQVTHITCKKKKKKMIILSARKARHTTFHVMKYARVSKRGY
jgi:hypothetical protein